MAILKSLAVVASIVGLVGIGTVVRRTVEPSASQVCSESACKLCNTAGASVDGSDSCGECSGGECSGGECLGRGEETSFVFEGTGPACSACAHEPNVVPEGEAIPGEITDTGDFLQESLDGNLVTATDVTFAEHINSESGMVLVDFYADWCGPCKVQGTILADYARSNPGVSVVKVNVDESPELAAKFKITGIPSLKVFRGDVLSAEHVGIADAATLNELLHLNNL